MNLFQRGLLSLFLGVAAVNVQATDLDPAAVAEDCRLEGEGEGLTNDDLESYVKDCIMTLLQEIDYTETDSKPNEG